MIGAMAVGVVGGAAAAVALDRAANRTLEGHDVASVDRGRSVAVLFIAADHDSRIERGVDTRTGNVGFSHVVVDAGERDDTGARLVYDCFPREGVRRVRLSERYGSHRNGMLRPMVRAVIPARHAERVRAALGAIVGQSYDVLTAFAPSRDRLVCSLMVMKALPRDLTRGVRPHSPRHPVSPNDLARAFGIAGPFSHDVMVS